MELIEHFPKNPFSEIILANEEIMETIRGIIIEHGEKSESEYQLVQNVIASLMELVEHFPKYLLSISEMFNYMKCFI